ncbi:MAG: extracellular solute-binding protein [Eubacteriales bacterium]|nr:extracellular solute-binding protein [Eubacteriales bacterium]
MRRLNIRTLLAVVLVTAFIASLFAGCAPDKGTVVIYTSVDQLYSEKIFDEYEKATGVKVKAVFDIEANKTVGLANKLIEEKSNPQADVFWNGEILQTIRLKAEGVLEAAEIANTGELPEAFVDADKQWYGFGGRARCLIYNKTLISYEDCPKTLEEFLISENVKQSAIAQPMFGTTSTHAAVLYALWGSEDAKKYYSDLAEAGVQVVDGNGVVKDQVSRKKLYYGLTDTDDALLEIASNSDLDVIFLDQEDGGIGTLVIPNTVARIKGGPNPEQAVKFMEWLLSAEVEQLLVDDEWIQIPVHPSVNASQVIEDADVRIMAADFEQAYEFYEESKNDLTSIFVR